MYLSSERSLSKNTVEAYLHDVNSLATFLGEEISPQKINLKDLQRFLKEINGLGIGPSSQSRILSGIRAFYKFLLLEEEIDSDPTLLLESPRLSRKLPDVLNEKELEELINAIDRSAQDGERNRAIIE